MWRRDPKRHLLGRPMLLLRLVDARDPVEAATAAARANWQQYAQLTPSERAVLAQLARGQSNHEIADALGKSPVTIRNQLHSIFKKLDVKRRGELVARLSAAGSH